MTRDGEVYKEYRTCVNQLRRLTKKATKQCEKKIASEAKNNPKLVFKYINSKTKIKSTIPDLYMTYDEDEDDMARDDLTKANVFAKFFASVQTRESENTWELLNAPEIQHDMKLEITREGLLTKLEKLNTSKAPGPDIIHPLVLHEIREAIVDPLLTIFQTSVRTGTVPDAWKVADSHRNI